MSETTKTNTYDFATIVPAFDKILSRGLCSGIGNPDGQVCIEAAICMVLGLPHGDDPKCVTKEIRKYKIAINDKVWSSPEARAEGLRDLGIAQIGSKGVVDGKEFVERLAEGTIKVLLPAMVREVGSLRKNKELMQLADRCEVEGTVEAARALKTAAYAVAAYAYAAAYTDAAAAAAAYAAAADAAVAAAYAAAADAAAAAYAAGRDRFLRLSASIALQILIDLKSPGAEWISTNAVEKLRTPMRTPIAPSL